MAAFLYQYLAGGLIFVLGLIFAWRSGDLSWKNREDRFSIVYLLAIFTVYLVGHLLWQVLASGGS